MFPWSTGTFVSERGEHWAGQAWPPSELTEVRWNGADPVFYRYVDVREVSPGCLVGRPSIDGGVIAVLVGSDGWERMHPSFASAVRSVSTLFWGKAEEMSSRAVDYSVLADGIEAAATAKPGDGEAAS